MPNYCVVLYTTIIKTIVVTLEQHIYVHMFLLRSMNQNPNFSRFSTQGNFNCLAMEFLGKSLEDHVQMFGASSLKSWCGWVI